MFRVLNVDDMVLVVYMLLQEFVFGMVCFLISFRSKLLSLFVVFLPTVLKMLMMFRFLFW